MHYPSFVKVDADPVAGICFVGIQSHGMRRGFVLVPFGICLIIGEVFMIRGMSQFMINQSINHSVNQSISQSNSQSTNLSINQSASGEAKGRACCTTTNPQR